MKSIPILLLFLALYPSLPAFAGAPAPARREYYPGIERDVYLGVRKTVQAGFCASPLPGASVERSFLHAGQLFVVWRKGTSARTVTYRIEDDKITGATIADGAAALMRVSTGNWLHRSERTALLDAGDRADLTRALSAEEFGHATSWDSVPKSSHPVGEKTRVAMEAIHVWDEVPGRSHTEVYDDLTGYCSDHTTVVIEGVGEIPPAAELGSGSAQ